MGWDVDLWRIWKEYEDSDKFKRPSRHAVLVRKSPKTGYISRYEVNVGIYKDVSMIWIRSRLNVQLKHITREINYLDLLVKYYDYIYWFEDRGYEIECDS
jgi:hypothetical protein